jgi:hypothetical protein
MVDLSASIGLPNLATLQAVDFSGLATDSCSLAVRIRVPARIPLRLVVREETKDGGATSATAFRLTQQTIMRVQEHA